MGIEHKTLFLFGVWNLIVVSTTFIILDVRLTIIENRFIGLLIGLITILTLFVFVYFACNVKDDKEGQIKKGSD